HFFFYYHVTHPDLHSFPTRRSSDLSARIEPLSEAAWMTLLGTIDSTMSMPRGWVSMLATMSRLRSAFCISSCAASVGSTPAPGRDRKSTRLNSSHVKISYAVFCLKK